MFGDFDLPLKSGPFPSHSQGSLATTSPAHTPPAPTVCSLQLLQPHPLQVAHHGPQDPLLLVLLLPVHLCPFRYGPLLPSPPITLTPSGCPETPPASTVPGSARPSMDGAGESGWNPGVRRLSSRLSSTHCLCYLGWVLPRLGAQLLHLSSDKDGLWDLPEPTGL